MSSKIVNFFFSSRRPATNHLNVTDSFNALEKFMAHMNKGNEVSTRSSQVEGTGSSDLIHKEKEKEEEEEQGDRAENIREKNKERGEDLQPTYHQISLPALIGFFDSAYQSLERLVAFVDEHAKVEGRYVRERQKVRLDYEIYSKTEDSLENALRAFTLFQDVEISQLADIVDEMDRTVKAPLLQLRDDIGIILKDCKGEVNSLDKEIDNHERKLAKAKVSLKRLREKKVDLREKIDYYRRVATDVATAYMNGTSTSQGFSPGSSLSAFFKEDFDTDSELSLIPTLERRVDDVEVEIRAATRSTETLVNQLLDAFNRQDLATRKWIEILQDYDAQRRGILLRSLMRFSALQCRLAQLRSRLLEDMSQLFSRVTIQDDMQRLIERGKTEGGGFQRSQAFRLLPLGISDDELPTTPKLSLTGSFTRSGDSSTTDASKGASNLPSDSEDEEIISLLMKQLFQGSAKKTSAALAKQLISVEPPDEEKTGMVENHKEDGNQQGDAKDTEDQSFKCEGLAADVKGLNIGENRYSTADERKRYYDKLFSHPKGRGKFLQELNQQRSQNTDVGVGFEELAEVMKILLLNCERFGDVDNAKMAMMLSQTFYHVEPGENVGNGGQDPEGEGEDRSQREFLSKRLIGHSLWSDPDFWDQALWRCVLEQLPTIEEINSQVWHDLSPQGRDELVLRVHNIIFSQVGALAHSMCEFGSPIAEAEKFVKRTCAKHQLSEEQRFLLLKHLSKKKEPGLQRKNSSW